MVDDNTEHSKVHRSLQGTQIIPRYTDHSARLQCVELLGLDPFRYARQALDLIATGGHKNLYETKRIKPIYRSASYLLHVKLRGFIAANMSVFQVLDGISPCDCGDGPFVFWCIRNRGKAVTSFGRVLRVCVCEARMMSHRHAHSR